MLAKSVADDSRRGVLRAEVGRLPVDRLPGRRRGRVRQPQRTADDPLLPRAGRGGQGRTARPVRDRRRDRDRDRHGPRLRRAAAADPPRGLAGPHAGREDAGFLHRLRPAGARRRRPHRPAVRRAPGRARDGIGPRRGAGSPHPGDPRPRGGEAMVRRVRGRGPRRRGGQAAGRHLPAGQAGHVQDQARADGRLRRRRLPAAQERSGRDRVADARPLHRRRHAELGRRDRCVPDGPAPGTLRRTATAG